MHVGLVCPYSLSLSGGVQAQVMELARALRSNGVDAKVLAPCDDAPDENWVVPMGNSIPYAQNGSLAPVAPDPAAQLRMLAAMRDERFDLLHLHEPLVPGPCLTALLMKSVPMVGTFHASGEVPIYKWVRPFAQSLIRRLDRYVAVSEKAAAMARKNVGIECEMLFNAVDLKKFADQKEQDQRPKTVFFIARHEPRKGLQTLLEASQYLDSAIEIRVAGEGPETEQLKLAFPQSNQIKWLGRISDHQKAQELGSAGVFCIPSLGGESFGIVLVEGMAAGAPIVASDLEAYSAVTKGTECAELFPVGDPLQLAAAIDRVFASPRATLERVESAHRRAFDFSMDELALEYSNIYEEMLIKR